MFLYLALGKYCAVIVSDLRVSVTSDKFNKQHQFSLKYEECWEPKENSWNSFEMIQNKKQTPLVLLIYASLLSNVKLNWWLFRLRSPELARSG